MNLTFSITTFLTEANDIRCTCSEKVVEAIFQNKRFIELSDDKKAIIPKSWVNSLKNYSGFFDFSDHQF